YRESFHGFISKLVKTVFTLTRHTLKLSKLTPFKFRIHEDLNLYPYDWRRTNPELFNPQAKEKPLARIYDKETHEDGNNQEVETELEEIPEIPELLLGAREGGQDIFTREISEDDPLWRVRAYIIGFLLADGYIKLRNKSGNYTPTLSIEQHKRDKDILENIKIALGGNLKPKNEKHFFYASYDGNLIPELIKYGMVERHSTEDIAPNLHPPSFIEKIINKNSLVRDFVRGFFDGDGTFYMAKDTVHLAFSFLAPKNFLEDIQKLIEKEIDDLTTFMLPYKINIIELPEGEFRLYGKNRIYIKEKGFRILDDLELNKYPIHKEQHKWLYYLYIRGGLNCVRFFNWLYCDDDNFDNFKIGNCKISGSRKYRKTLKAIGDKTKRKEKLTPDWKDMLFKMVNILEKKYYSLREIQDLINELLKKELQSQNSINFLDKKRIKDVDNLARKLKNLEYRMGLIGSYLKKEGRYNRRYYYNPLKSLSEMPDGFYKDPNLISIPNEIVLENVKNLIVKIFLSDNKWRKFKAIRELILKLNKLGHSALRPHNLYMFVLELCYFDILLVDDESKELDDQKYFLNTSVLTKFYKRNIDEIKSELKDIYKN
ncbi:MAG: hypothetical protein P8Y23_12540, partial [Candidatus Lokiarchaeota archaeon]